MAAARYVIGLDLGTTGVKAVGIGEAGEVLASTRADLTRMHEGWQPLEEVWQAAGVALRSLMQRVDGEPAAMGVSGAMHTLLPLGADGRPLSDALTWACPQVEAESPDVYATGSVDLDALYLRTGCPAGSLYHPRRVAWLRSWMEAGRLPSIAAWSGMKEQVLRRFTGRWATDHSIASSTGLMNIHERTWDAEALRLAGIDDSAMLPRPVGTTEVVGELQREAAAHTGLPVGLPIVAGASDGALANVGAGADLGDAVITLGTSGAVRYIADRPAFDEQRRTWCYIIDENRYLIGAAINNGGIVLQHVIDAHYADLEPGRRFAVAMDEAAAVGPGADGLLLLPFLTGERDLIWPAGARLEWVGLDETKHDRSHRVRATMEAVAAMIGKMWDVLSPPPQRGPVRLTGGVTRNGLWMRMLADLTGLPLSPIEAADASVLGAAVFAWRGIGHSLPRVSSQHEPLVTPNPGMTEAYRPMRGAFEAACAERGWQRG